MVESHGGKVLDYNTDAINGIFENNEFPFELFDDIQLNGHYWDKSNKVHKYKIECDKERLKTSRMQQSLRTNKYEMARLYKWKITSDVEDNNFKPLVCSDAQICLLSWVSFGLEPATDGSGRRTLLL